MVQQNSQTGQNSLNYYKNYLYRTRIFFTELLSSIDWNWFKIKYGNAFSLYGVQSKSKLAKLMMGELLTFMFEDMIETDTVYYYHKDKKVKFYISRSEKKYGKISFGQTDADIAKLERLYQGSLLYPTGDKVYQYMIILPRLLRKKLDEASINGATYRDGRMEYSPGRKKHKKSDTKDS